MSRIASTPATAPVRIFFLCTPPDDVENTTTVTPPTHPVAIHKTHPAQTHGHLFEPLPSPQNVGVCIDSLLVGAAALSWSLKVGDVLRSVDDKGTGGKSFVEVMGLIERAEDSSNVRLLFRIPTANAAVEADVEKGEEEIKEKEKITATDHGIPALTTHPPPHHRDRARSLTPTVPSSSPSSPPTNPVSRSISVSPTTTTYPPMTEWGFRMRW